MSQCAMFSVPCVWTYLIILREVDWAMKTSTNAGPNKEKAACMSRVEGRSRWQEGHILEMICNERTIRDDGLHNVVPME